MRAVLCIFILAGLAVSQNPVKHRDSAGRDNAGQRHAGQARQSSAFGLTSVTAPGDLWHPRQQRRAQPRADRAGVYDAGRAGDEEGGDEEGGDEEGGDEEGGGELRNEPRNMPHEARDEDHHPRDHDETNQMAKFTAWTSEKLKEWATEESRSAEQDQSAIGIQVAGKSDDRAPAPGGDGDGERPAWWRTGRKEHGRGDGGSGGVAGSSVSSGGGSGSRSGGSGGREAAAGWAHSLGLPPLQSPRNDPANVRCQEQAGPDLGPMVVLRDVCLVDTRTTRSGQNTESPVCNAKDSGTLDFRPRAELERNRSQSLAHELYSVRAEYPGLSAFIRAEHGQGASHYHWDNYEHWVEGCLVFHTFAQRHAGAVHRAAALGQHTMPVRQVVLHQASAQRVDCGRGGGRGGGKGGSGQGIYSLRGRGNTASEAFEVMARASALGLGAGRSSRPFTGDRSGDDRRLRLEGTRGKARTQPPPSVQHEHGRRLNRHTQQDGQPYFDQPLGQRLDDEPREMLDDVLLPPRQMHIRRSSRKPDIADGSVRTLQCEDVAPRFATKAGARFKADQPRPTFVETHRRRRLGGKHAAGATSGAVTSVACFEAVVMVAPVEGRMFTRLLDNLSRGEAHAFAEDVWKVLGQWPERVHRDFTRVNEALKAASGGKRVVSLLTRQGGPVWRNRDQVAKELELAVAAANTALKLALQARRDGGGALDRGARGGGTAHGGFAFDGRPFAFVDLGHAENLGKNGDCVHSAHQAAAWRASWVVVAPHGAHNSNAIFMHPLLLHPMNSASRGPSGSASGGADVGQGGRRGDCGGERGGWSHDQQPAPAQNWTFPAGGLVESFSCGHYSETYQRLAAASGVRYHAARELNSDPAPGARGGAEARVGCDQNQGRKHLDEPRDVTPEHDTLFSVVAALLNRAVKGQL